MKRSAHLGTVMILWGLWLLSPYWDTFTSGPAFQVMQRLASENVWGAGAFLLGLAALLAKQYNYRQMEISIAVAMAFFWGLVATTYLLSSFGTLGVPIYAWLCLYAADTATEIFNQRRRSDHR